MDKEEARQMLDAIIETYREKKHQDLIQLMRAPLTYEITGSSGVEYQVEIQAFWDSPRKEGDNIRVLVSIDDGRFPYAFMPMIIDFIMTPEDAFLDDES
jgi:hypothetical protein